MRLKFLSLFISAVFSAPILISAQYESKELVASRCTVAPKIDGSLDDVCWASAAVAKDFIADLPTPGVPMEHPTEAQIVYDDEAVYLAIMNFDPSPDSILQQMSGRDADGNSDYCGITFSCYQDGINGLTFAVTPRGEQWDARDSNTSGEDVSWNAVWYCKTTIVPNGWIAEFKIPFAALRFPDQEEQTWSINFFREIRRIRQHGFWSGVNPEVAGYLTQLGTLKGLKDIKPPKRIFLYPYASYYQNYIENTSGGVENESSWNAGLDVKIGLNDAFTLDATLVPDFGQVISDQQFLNLSPFEVQFQDNRQFFIEGTELFNKGGLFYSRRVGYLPPSANLALNEGDEVVSTPFQTQLLNASKISGRNKKGLGIGFFNAITAKAEAVVVDSNGVYRNEEVAPLTNYNVLVFDQNLKNNSFFSLVNTNVTRQGSAYDANVLGTEFDLRNKSKSWSITGNGAYNRKFGPDYQATESERDGFAANLSLNKIDGNWRYSVGHALESDTYDPTDLGFLQANNSSGSYVWVQYNQFKPFWKINKVNTSVAAYYNKLYHPNVFTDVFLESYSYITTNKFTTYNITYLGSPVRGYDYFEPRVDGKFFRTYTYNRWSGWISSDYRKTLAIDAGAGFANYENENRRIFNWNFSPRWRVSDKLMLVYSYRRENHFNDLGFATFADNAQPVFGQRDVVAHTNVFTANFAFTPVMTINCRVRHYWGFSKYKEFYNLADDGYLAPSDYVGFQDEEGNPQAHSNSDRNFTSFTIDLFYRWIFLPGSEISVVWKNQITQFGFGEPLPVSLSDDLSYTFGLPQSNSLSIKVLYFLDYRSLLAKNNKA